MEGHGGLGLVAGLSEKSSWLILFPTQMDGAYRVSCLVLGFTILVPFMYLNMECRIKKVGRGNGVSRGEP